MQVHFFLFIAKVISIIIEKGKINIDNRNFCSAQMIIAIIDIQQDPYTTPDYTRPFYMHIQNSVIFFDNTILPCDL